MIDFANSNSELALATQSASLHHTQQVQFWDK